jgi:outer membrane lipoprotein SlyB
MRTVRYVSFALALLTLAGCADKKCLSGDSATTCKALTECFDRGNTAKACRQIEKDQAEYERNFQKNIAPAYTGAGSALSYDPNKATQKPPAKTQPKK